MNEYVWKLYLESGGYKVVDFFKENIGNKITIEYVRWYKKTTGGILRF